MLNNFQITDRHLKRVFTLPPYLFYEEKTFWYPSTFKKQTYNTKGVITLCGFVGWINNSKNITDKQDI